MSQINHNKFILPPHQFRGFQPKTRVAEANAASVQKERGYWVREWASTCGQSKPSLAGRGPCQCTLRRQQAECPADGTWTTASVRRLLLLPLPTLCPALVQKNKGYLLIALTFLWPIHSCALFPSAVPLPSPREMFQGALFLHLADGEQTPRSCSSPPASPRVFLHLVLIQCLSGLNSHQNHLGAC